MSALQHGHLGTSLSLSGISDKRRWDETDEQTWSTRLQQADVLCCLLCAAFLRYSVRPITLL